MIAVLGGCGGGGGGDDDGDTILPTSRFSISGTAAQGLAIGNSLVEAKCRSGSARVISDAAGRYSFTIDNAAQPCLIRVTDAISGLKLHSLTSEYDDTAHITPFSELLTAQILGVNPDDAFNDFNKSFIDRITAGSIAEHMQSLREALKPIADLADINFLKVSFQPKTDTSVGDALDRNIEKLMGVLNFSNKTLDSLSLAIAQNPTAPATALTGLLGPAVNGLASCPVLRSGKYWLLSRTGQEKWLIDFNMFTQKAATVESQPVDITFKQVEDIDTDGKSHPLTCELALNLPNEPDPYLVHVTPGGLGFVSSANYQFSGFLVPAQQLTLAELAGSWDGMYFSKNGMPSDNYPQLLRAEYSSSGQATYDICNQDPVYCGSSSKKNASIQIDQQGLLQRSYRGEAIAYRSSNGDMVMLSTVNHSGLQIEAKRSKPLTLPILGSSYSVREFWFQLPDTFLTAPSFHTYTNTAVNKLTYQVTLLESVTKLVSTLNLNGPRNGMKFFPKKITPTEASGLVFLGIGGQGWELNSTAAAEPGYGPFQVQMVVERTVLE